MRRTMILMGGIVLALGLGAISPTLLHASDARTNALGIQREYLEDYILFRSFPTVIARYENLVTASLGDRNARDRSVGVIGSGRNSDYGTFAIYLNDLGNDAGQDAQLDLTWAKQFSGAALGLGLNWTSSSMQTGEIVVTPIGGHTAALEANQLAFIGGIKLDMGSDDQFEAAVEVASLSWEDDIRRSENDNGASYRVSARMMNQVSPKTTLVPLAQYSHVDLTAKGDADETNFNTLNLGVAAHHEVNSGDLLVMGIAANYFTTKRLSDGSDTSNEFSRWDLPALFVALEFSVYDWLTGRVGATKTIDVSTSDPAGGTDDETDTTNSRFFFGLGMGIHFDHFDVDATVNPDAIFTGGYLFSGESSRPLARVTGTYFF